MQYYYYRFRGHHPQGRARRSRVLFRYLDTTFLHVPFCQCNIVEACFDIYKIFSAAHKINDEMIDCIAPAAHAFELAVKWIWPPGAEPVQPQEIHVIYIVLYIATCTRMTKTQ